MKTEGPPSTLRIIAGLVRAPFLLLTLACVLLGSVCALAEYQNLHGELPGDIFDVWFFLSLVLVICCATSAHAAVNALNEYHDFSSGLDLATQRTPFSGGSGTLPKFPNYQGFALRLGLFCVGLCVFSGLGLGFIQGWRLVLLGLLGSLLVVGYTPWINRHPWLCLVAPGLGFGVVMIIGTVLALGQQPSVFTFYASALVFFLANNLLLVNQLPDRVADQRFGRKTYPVVYGEQATKRMISLQFCAAYGIVLLAFGIGVWSFWSTLCLFSIPLVMRIVNVLDNAASCSELVPAQQATVQMSLILPLLLGLSLLLGMFAPAASV